MKHPPAPSVADGESRATSSTARVTYYVALPFTRDEQGDLVAGEPMELQSSRSAIGTGPSHGLQGWRCRRILPKR